MPRIGAIYCGSPPSQVAPVSFFIRLMLSVTYFFYLIPASRAFSDPPASITMFTTHQKRFEKRFEVFRTLSQPPSLSYDDYVKGSDFSAVQGKDLLASAADCFRSAKGIVDSLLDVIVSEECVHSLTRGDDDLYISIRRQEILQIAKVCVSNSLFLHKLALMKGSDLNSGERSVSLEFKAHKLYCTLIIT